MTTTQTKWFVTFSDHGDGAADGFYCPECYHGKIESADIITSGLVSEIDPENAPKYICDICNKDYRD